MVILTEQTNSPQERTTQDVASLLDDIEYDLEQLHMNAKSIEVQLSDVRHLLGVDIPLT